MADILSYELLPSALRTVDTASALQDNVCYDGVILHLDVTAASGTGGLIVQVRGYDPIIGTHDIMTSIPVPVRATGQYSYHFYPGADFMHASIQYATSLRLTRLWSAIVTHRDGSNYTYSLSYSLVGPGG